LNHYFEFYKKSSPRIEYIALLTLHNFDMGISVIISWQPEARLSICRILPHKIFSGTSLAIIKFCENAALTNIDWHNFSIDKRSLLHSWVSYCLIRENCNM